MILMILVIKINVSNWKQWGQFIWLNMASFQEFMVTDYESKSFKDQKVSGLNEVSLKGSDD